MACLHDNPAGYAFCGQCGVALEHFRCFCGFINTASAHYCGGCGGKLTHTEKQNNVVMRRRYDLTLLLQEAGKLAIETVAPVKVGQDDIRRMMEDLKKGR